METIISPASAGRAGKAVQNDSGRKTVRNSLRSGRNRWKHLCALKLNVDHIVDDNIERFPDTLKENKNLCRRLLNGAIEETKKRLLANYKLAVPHCYENRVQLLIPIYLTGEGNPDIALAIEKTRINIMQ